MTNERAILFPLVSVRAFSLHFLAFPAWVQSFIHLHLIIATNEKSGFSFIGLSFLLPFLGYSSKAYIA